MILVNKLYNGEALNINELHFLATGFCFSNMENMIDKEDMDAITFIDEQDGDSGRWTKHKTTIFKVNNDLWCVEWEEGLTECQENEFYEGMRVNIYRHTIGFKQSFSGKVTARRIGG